jgi:transcriptional antiterminator NusG
MTRVAKGIDKILLEPGAVVRVTDGPFNNFRGIVESVNYEDSKARVAVQMLGRSRLVELEFRQFVSISRVPTA